MGLLNKIWTKLSITGIEKMELICAPISGKYIPLNEMVDPVFSQEIMGRGCGIQPDEGVVVAPANGVVSAIAPTKHAVGIVLENGAELLIHVGMDTVNMNGVGFEMKVSEGAYVKCGETLMHFDIEAIQKVGGSVTTAFVVTNSDSFSEIQIDVGKEYKRNEQIGIIGK